jgi:CheY-like chemotaxis protein
MPRVLVVDDCNDTTASLSMLLRLLGHDVRAASGGYSALAVAADFQPDAAVVDIVMPGLDGYDVARHLRAIPGLENTLIIALSGYGGGQDRRAPAGDFDVHLIKPVNPRDLARLLSDLENPISP